MAASLLGIFTGADASGSTARTTSSRTTTAGSLVTICGAGWDAVTGQSVTLTDNKSNSYTELFESEFGAFVNFALAYNLAGTRGATHTCTNTISDGGTLNDTGCSVTAQEWDGIDAAPTVDTGTLATGTGTAASCSVTVSGGAALVIGMMCYDGTAGATIAVNSGTQASEQDEDNSSQAQNVAYKLTQTGSVTISWTISASRTWGCRAVAFTEAGGGGAAGQPTARRLGMVEYAAQTQFGHEGVRIMRDFREWVRRERRAA